MFSISRKFISACPAWATAANVFAHEGHGMGASHWHASDVLGFVVVIALAAVVLWRSRK